MLTLALVNPDSPSDALAGKLLADADLKASAQILELARNAACEALQALVFAEDPDLNKTDLSRHELMVGAREDMALCVQLMNRAGVTDVSVLGSD